MIALRQINKTYFLSGGWSNVEKDCRYLAGLGIQAVLDLQYLPEDGEFNKQAEKEIKPALEYHGIAYKVIPMRDGGNKHLDQIFEAGFQTVQEWLLEGKKRILIKCGVGASRSPAMLIYIMMQLFKTYEEAFEEIYEASPIYMDQEFVRALKGKRDES